MNILIDTSPLENANAVRGIGRYTRELVRALAEVQTEHQIYTSDQKPTKVDLVHYPFFDFFFPTLPLRKRAKTVVTIHDAIPLVFAKHYPAGIKGTINHWRQRFSLRGVSHIITDSECSKRDIIATLHVNSEQITAVPLAASADMHKPPQAAIDQVRKKYELPKRYILYVGDINYSKNLPFLLRVIKKLGKVHLVMVGSQVNNASIPEGKEIQSAIDELGIAHLVHRISTIGVDGTKELCALYAGAQAYIQPSLYEGFGLPILEAMQCRVPVVSSVGGSLPEIAGDAAVFFHPHQEDDCASAIMKVLRFSPAQRLAAIRRGVEQASTYSWQRTAIETLAVYEKVGQA